MSRPRILALVWNEDSKRSLRFTIGKIGEFDLVMTSTVEEAIAAAEERAPDLALVSVRTEMEGTRPVRVDRPKNLHGAQVIERIRALNGGAEVPIYVLWPCFARGVEPQASEFDCQGYFWTPVVHHSVLREEFERHLDSREGATGTEWLPAR